MKEKPILQQKWFKLDNAAKIFPGQNKSTWSNIFRITAELKEQVKPEILVTALERVMPRFPCFKVRMKNGFFWHYFAENPYPAPPLLPDINNPCHRIKFKENLGYMLRVYYRENRVSVEAYHSLCDGYGCAVFLGTVLGEYYRLQGEEIGFSDFVLNPESPATPEEMEDSFVKNASSKAKYKRSDKFVYHAIGDRLPKHTVHIISGTVSFKELHKITKEKGVTVTEYLAAALLKVHIEKQRREQRKQKEVCVQVPINLRRTFGSKTLRNFTVCLRTKTDPNRGDMTFDELLRLVSLQLRLANNKNDLNMMMTANLALERNRLLRLMPLALKDLGIAISFLITGEQTTTALLTNLGPVSFPAQLEEHIERIILVPSLGIRNAARCGVSTFGDKLVITFADVFEQTDIERDFFTFLVKNGLHVKIESNF